MCSISEVAEYIQGHIVDWGVRSWVRIEQLDPRTNYKSKSKFLYCIKPIPPLSKVFSPSNVIRHAAQVHSISGYNISMASKIIRVIMASDKPDLIWVYNRTIIFSNLIYRTFANILTSLLIIAIGL